MLRFGLVGVVAFSRAPLRAALVLGLVLAAAGTVFFAVALARSIAAGVPLLGGTALAGLVIALSGVQLVAVGVLGEYLGAVLDEVRARPHYVVEERINL
jgi:dolichol-phosphate mannosyltransferase